MGGGLGSPPPFAPFPAIAYQKISLGNSTLTVTACGNHRLLGHQKFIT